MNLWTTVFVSVLVPTFGGVLRAQDANQPNDKQKLTSIEWEHAGNGVHTKNGPIGFRATLRNKTETDLTANVKWTFENDGVTDVARKRLTEFSQQSIVVASNEDNRIQLDFHAAACRLLSI